jgi:hypothetical protein
MIAIGMSAQFVAALRIKGRNNNDVLSQFDNETLKQQEQAKHREQLSRDLNHLDNKVTFGKLKSQKQLSIQERALENRRNRFKKQLKNQAFVETQLRNQAASSQPTQTQLFMHKTDKVIEAPVEYLLDRNTKMAPQQHFANAARSPQHVQKYQPSNNWNALGQMSPEEQLAAIMQSNLTAAPSVQAMHELGYMR